MVECLLFFFAVFLLVLCVITATPVHGALCGNGERVLMTANAENPRTDARSFAQK
jgi:hypothetical protein